MLIFKAPPFDLERRTSASTHLTVAFKSYLTPPIFAKFRTIAVVSGRCRTARSARRCGLAKIRSTTATGAGVGLMGRVPAPLVVHPHKKGQPTASWCTQARRTLVLFVSRLLREMAGHQPLLWLVILNTHSQTVVWLLRRPFWNISTSW